MINLLECVLPMISNLIDPTESLFEYRSLNGETVNEIGVKVPKYTAWKKCQGSVQPVQRNKYEDLGLDWSKNYVNVWGSIVLTDLYTAKQPSQIRWKNKLFNVTAITEWNPHNGWMNCTAVQDDRYNGRG